MYDEAAAAGGTILINGDLYSGSDHDAFRANNTLQRLRTPWVVVWRSNFLDQCICVVRDCFDRQSPIKLGHPMYKGEPSKLCYSRRWVDHEHSEYKAHLYRFPTQAYLGAQKAIMGPPAGLRLSRMGLHSAGSQEVVVVKYEDLTAVQYPDADETGEFATGVDAFSRILNAWQVSFSAQQLEQCMLPLRGQRGRPGPHASVVHNIDELKDSPIINHYMRY